MGEGCMRKKYKSFSGLKKISTKAADLSQTWGRLLFNAHSLPANNIYSTFWYDYLIEMPFKHTIRGMYIQRRPNTSSYLLQLLSGSGAFIMLDLRHGKTKADWFFRGIETNEQFYIPAGCALGFLSYEDNTRFLLKSYNKLCDDLCVRIPLDDPTMGFEMPEELPNLDSWIISQKDRHGIMLSELMDEESEQYLWK